MLPNKTPPSSAERNIEIIMSSGSIRIADIKRFLPKPISAPENSATIAPITLSVAEIFKPVKMF